MPTDLTTVRDHPALLIAQERDRLGERHHAFDGMEWAHNTLTDHEQRKGVTFAALDNEALAEVRRAYDNHRDGHPLQSAEQSIAEVLDAVRDLLGLDD